MSFVVSVGSIENPDIRVLHVRFGKGAMMPEILEQLANVNLLRYRQRAEMQDEHQSLEHELHNPQIQQRGAITKQLRQLDKQLASQSPRAITPSEKDLLMRKERELREQIRAGMLTHEEMRKNPAGSVHRHMQWEKANKRNINLWKNIKIQLEPESSDQDLANIETFRPHTPDNGTSTFMVNAQIPGHFAMSSAAKANWPEELSPQGTVNSPLMQVRKRTKTAEERAEFGERMKQARAAKKQATQTGE